jgi:signal transduction histidine kinase
LNSFEDNADAKNKTVLHSKPKGLILPCSGRSWTPWACYLFATAATVLTYLLRLLLGVAYGQRPLLILFVFPIILSAYVGGIGPGIFSTILATALIDYFLLPPAGSFQIAFSYDLAQLLMLVINGVAISVLIEALRRHRSGMEKLAIDKSEANRRLEAEIAERIRTEAELQRKREEMEQFVYMVSHDLKSPLVTINTFLGYLRQDLEKPDYGRALEDTGHIRGASENMGRLLNELLELSRIGRTGNPPCRATFRELVDEAVQMVQGDISRSGAEIRIGSCDTELFGDRPRLVAIWQNLLDNAVKNMGTQNDPLIEIGAEGSGPDTSFFVRDNGMGIEPGDLEMIFHFGVKLNPKSDGSGLGLAIAKRIVELYKGEISVSSDGPGRGACFRFTLPEAARRANGETP